MGLLFYDKYLDTLTTLIKRCKSFPYNISSLHSASSLAKLIVVVEICFACFGRYRSAVESKSLSKTHGWNGVCPCPDFDNLYRNNIQVLI